MLFNIHVKLVDVKPETRSVSGKIVSGGQGCQDTFFRPNSLLLVGTVHLYVPAKQRHGRRPTHLRVEAEAQVDNGALTRRELNHSPVVKEQNLEGLKERPNANGADGRRGIKPFISADERRKSSLEALLSLPPPLQCSRVLHPHNGDGREESEHRHESTQRHRQHKSGEGRLSMTAPRHELNQLSGGSLAGSRHRVTRLGTDGHRVHQFHRDT